MNDVQTAFVWLPVQPAKSGAISIMARSDGEMYAARISKLGLTAYGRTVDDAKMALEELVLSWLE